MDQQVNIICKINKKVLVKAKNKFLFLRINYIKPETKWSNYNQVDFLEKIEELKTAPVSVAKDWDEL